ncbi:EF-hand [Hanseniaspora valbyensis NRRL Y-1626]|uniref:Calcineurin subunit B n=1 Tax=Hanseniaspora valbyensis NRRL Y-1626 TaxID=766949 RepID=A0A1B7TGL8_9ASCO|nr:EF-hand [Hanseniaspora valbyensis NRRL Y-1626]
MSDEDYYLPETIFTEEELERLRKRFQKIDTDNSGCIEKDEFMSIPGVSGNPLAMRIMDVLDIDGNGLLSFDEFINGLSIFLTNEKSKKQGSTKHEKLMFAFKIFDIDNDGYISNGELFIVLKMMLGDNLSDEHLQDLVDRAIMEADVYNDHMISFEEFILAIKTTEVEKSLTLDFNI